MESYQCKKCGEWLDETSIHGLCELVDNGFQTKEELAKIIKDDWKLLIRQTVKEMIENGEIILRTDFDDKTRIDEKLTYVEHEKTNDRS